MECDTRIPRFRRPGVVEDDQTGEESSCSVFSPGHPTGIALSDSEKAEALADNLEAQFEPVTDPSVQAVIEMIYVALKSYLMTPASEPKLTNPEEAHEIIKGVKISKVSGLNGIPNRALKHVQQRAISFLVLIFNAILLTHHFPTTWKHARVISIT